MKNILLSVFILVNFISCKPDPERIPDKHIYYYLTAEQLAKTPYFTNPAFDTLSFVSNQNDTVVFAKTRVDSGWYREIDFNPGVEFTTYHYYQQISANYQTIKGDGSFGVVHSKKLAGGYTDQIEFTFKNLIFYARDNRIGTNNGTIYFEAITLGGKIYFKVNKYYYDRSKSNIAECYLNNEYGLIQILDKLSDTEYSLIK